MNNSYMKWIMMIASVSGVVGHCVHGMNLKDQNITFGFKVYPRPQGYYKIPQGNWHDIDLLGINAAIGLYPSGVWIRPKQTLARSFRQNVVRVLPSLTLGLLAVVNEQSLPVIAGAMTVGLGLGYYMVDRENDEAMIFGEVNGTPASRRT